MGLLGAFLMGCVMSEGCIAKGRALHLVLRKEKVGIAGLLGG